MREKINALHKKAAFVAKFHAFLCLVSSMMILQYQGWFFTSHFLLCFCASHFHSSCVFTPTVTSCNLHCWINLLEPIMSMKANWKASCIYTWPVVSVDLSCMHGIERNTGPEPQQSS